MQARSLWHERRRAAPRREWCPSGGSAAAAWANPAASVGVHMNASEQGMAVAASPALLEVGHWTKHFPMRGGVFGRARGSVHAVDDVSFAICQGETLGLVGESGC